MPKLDLHNAHILIRLIDQESLNGETNAWYTTYNVDVRFSDQAGDSDLRWSCHFPPYEQFEKMALHFKMKTEGGGNIGSDYGQALYSIFNRCFMEGWQNQASFDHQKAANMAGERLILLNEPSSAFGNSRRLLIQKGGFTIEDLIQVMEEVYKVGQACHLAHPDMILTVLRPNPVIVNGTREPTSKAAI